jgi:hypothetical protein
VQNEELIMPREFLPPQRGRESKGEAKQAPEPMNRIVRRETVTDRRATKQALCQCAAFNEDRWPTPLHARD